MNKYKIQYSYYTRDSGLVRVHQWIYGETPEAAIKYVRSEVGTIPFATFVQQPLITAIQPAPPQIQTHSKEWFEKAFEGIEASPEIKNAAWQICVAYGITGTADPGYIANTITMFLNPETIPDHVKKLY